MTPDPPSLLPRFAAAGRRRPVDLVVPRSSLGEVVAPYAAATGPGPAFELASGTDRLAARCDGRTAWLEVTTGGRTSRHRSRRHGRTGGPPRELGLALTGTHASVLTRGPGPWVVRARADLRGRVDTRDGGWLAGLVSDAPVSGRFGQLGLRDLRLVESPPGGPVLLSATSAGPGFFDTAHTSLWELDPATLGLTHVSDLFFRRPDRPGVFGDHATHVLRDGDGWLVATSTWGDFDPRRPAVGVTLARTAADLRTGVHLLDTEPLPLPVDGLRSVGVWDPHLVRTGDGWLVGFVSATEFFRFHPALAAGPTLDDLTLQGAATGLTQAEGTTLAHLGGDWRVLASDQEARRYPVFDLRMRETGELCAPYPTNIPWPTLVPLDGSWLLVGFNGRPQGGPVAGYGTHGDVVLCRTIPQPA
ncbi:hypothetical protein [Nocardioides sp. T2.26MG-1]|uniref:hypothetical protein n=1 Tax=Nocardioides sp. T2.26MG-1 TaxID=3041166 RepID=UPI002477A256|nr:hypothetical protein [Nocardioides sp. T2.26MG-1]CAI9412628.1 hypothetical protein HIDPHFAB_01819 [Nocardioides sp. T2.26MG-1]